MSAIAFALKTLQVVLALAAAGLLGITSVVLVMPVSVPGVASGVAPRSARETAEPSEYDIIEVRNLFRRKVEVAEAPPPAPVPTVLSVKLLGTLLAQGAARTGSLAILRDVGGRVVTVAEGDRFADGHATLVEVKRHRIVLDHDGRLEAVSIDEPSITPGQVAQRTTGLRPASVIAR